MRPESANRTKVPKGASKPATTNAGTYEKWSTTHPVLKIKIIEPMPAPVPPKPATEATALSEKKSLGRVCTLLIQPEIRRAQHRSISARLSHRAQMPQNFLRALT